MSQGGWLEFEESIDHTSPDEISFSKNVLVALIVSPENSPRPSEAANQTDSDTGGQDPSSRSGMQLQTLIFEMGQETIISFDEPLHTLANQATLGLDSRTLHLKAGPGAQLPREPESDYSAPDSPASSIMRQALRQLSYTEGAGIAPSVISEPVQ